MSQLLTTEQKIATTSGLDCTIEELLGSGGQGEVYRARLGNQAVALKWYHPYYIHQDADLRQRLEQVVQTGAPNETFLWPMAIVTPDQGVGFGYVMRLRELRYRSLVDWVKRRINVSFRALATSGFELADSFLKLHSLGLCYRDISFGNVFFEPRSGQILICDNDNVTIDGSKIGGVLGTPDFMAPEVVRREAIPSKQTDLYSLSVLLFYLFHVHHPLYGKKVLDIRCLDLPARMQLCGRDPLFIFDPDDRSNEALPESIDPSREAGANALAFWSIYPKFLRDLFVRSFTLGLRDPEQGRVRESIWRAAMVRLRDSIFHCQHCKAENFYDIEMLKAAGGQPGLCWHCQESLQIPPRIRIDSTIVMLNPDTNLYPHHTNVHKLYDFSKPVAAVVPGSDSTQLALQNLAPQVWSVTTIEGLSKPIAQGEKIDLQAGLKISFGNTEGEIRM